MILRLHTYDHRQIPISVAGLPFYGGLNLKIMRNRVNNLNEIELYGSIL